MEIGIVIAVIVLGIVVRVVLRGNYRQMTGRRRHDDLSPWDN